MFFKEDSIEYFGDFLDDVDFKPKASFLSSFLPIAKETNSSHTGDCTSCTPLIKHLIRDWLYLYKFPLIAACWLSFDNAFEVPIIEAMNF